MAKNKKALIVILILVALTALGLILGLTLRDDKDHKPDPFLEESSQDGDGSEDIYEDGSQDESSDTDPSPVVVLPSQSWPHDESDISADPAVHFGILENGFRYMIMNNNVPEEEVAIRMHVDVGSFHEEDDQLGLAHFLEHMMFNGIEGYPTVESLLTTVNSLGIDFGPHLNAYTAFDETVYEMQLRDNLTSTLEITFGIFRGWADGALFIEEEIEREREVVLSELQTTETARDRLTEQLLDFLVPNTRLPDRWPGGTEEVIELLQREEFIEYYSKFYIPSRMTYVVVGAVDVEDMEALIETTFGSMSNPTSQEEVGEDPDLGMVETGLGLQVKVLPDDEFIYNEIYLYSARNFESKPDTVENRIDSLSLTIANRILTRRLQLLTVQEDTDISYGNAVAHEVWANLADFPFVTVDHVEGRLREGLHVLEQEFRRFMEFGILNFELEEAKAVLTNSYEAKVERAETRGSADLANWLSYSINGRYVASSPLEDLEILMQAIEDLTPERVHEDFFLHWNTTDIQLVYMTKETAQAPEVVEQLLETSWHESQLIPVEPPVDPSDVTFGYTDFGPPGSVVSESLIEDLDIRQIVLSNNVRINLKKTDFADNSIILRARFGNGRLSQPLDQPGFLYWFAEVMMNSGGLGLHSPDELSRLNAGKTVDIVFQVNDDHFSMSGDTNPDDLELWLQLLAAHLTDSGYRDEAVRLFRHDVPIYIDYLEHTLDGPFEQVFTFLKGDDPRFALDPEEALLALEADDARAWLDPELADSYLELSIVGEIPDTIMDYILHTVGALPTRANAPDTSHDRDLVFPDTPQSVTFNYESDNPVAAVLMAWEIPPISETTINVTRQINILANVLEDRIRAQVREELGAAYEYAASVWPHEAFDHGELVAYAIVDPQDTSLVLERMRSIAQDLVQNVITADEFTRAVTPFLEDLEDMLQSNEHWVNLILDGSQMRPYYLDWARNRGAFYDTVTKEDIDDLADVYLPLEKAISFELLPVSSTRKRERALLLDVEDVRNLKFKAHLPPARLSIP